MTTTTAIGPATANFTNPAIPTTTHTMSIDELMIWLGSQLESAGGEIKDQMDEVVAQRNQNAALQTIMNELRAFRRHTDGGDDGGLVDMKGATIGAKNDKWVEWANDPASLHDESWYQALSPDAQGRIDEFMTDIRGGGDTLATAHIIDNTLQVLSDEVNANSSQNEMKMIRLQSLISARSQAVQLATNELNAMNEALKSIIANIRA